MNPRTYEVRISGPVPAGLVDALDVAEVSAEPARTVIRTTPSDQAALLGLLERLRASGVELLEVRQVLDEADAEASAEVDAEVDAEAGAGVVEGPGVRTRAEPGGESAPTA
jgi:hypothetical protein